MTVWGNSDAGTLGTAVVPYAVRLLRRLGYRARARLVPSNYWDQHPGVFKTIQLISSAEANGTTFQMIYNNLSCSAPNNTGFFCDHGIDRASLETNRLEAKDPQAAAVRWAKIDRGLVDQAAWVPLVNIRWVDFVSARVHNYVADPTVGLIADQVSLR